ncbi:MAG: AAA family ATPase [Candidatus Nanopelagicales bacterium]
MRLTQQQQAELQAQARRLSEALPGFTVHAPTGEFASLEFGHRRGDLTYYLPEDVESVGTRALLAAGLLISSALATGGLVVIDEIDASLHPVLVDDLVGLFRSELTNPRGAQLLATSHDTAQHPVSAEQA